MVGILRTALAKPVRKALRSKLRHLSLWSNARRPPGEWCVRQKVGQLRQVGGQAGPVVNQPHHVGAARAQATLIVMGKKLCFVGRNIHVHRTLSLASLACQAEIQRGLHVLIVPAIPQHVSLQHFKKQMRAPACAVGLFTCDHITGAHRPAATSAACANSDAAQGRVREIALIFGELEVRLESGWIVCSAQAQILVHTIGVDHLAWIHQTIGVPDPLEFAESLNQLLAVHLWQQLAARLAVAVLAGE